MPTKRVPEMRFDLDFSAPPPAMTSAAVGIDRVSHRSVTAQHRDITIFDTSDERLLRAGIVVAHRIVGGVGEWYMAAPAWHPRLPAERVEPLDATAGLPDLFSRLIKPVTRRAPLAPVAALDCDKQEYLMRDRAGTMLGFIVDDRVTLRRGESAVAHYREVTVTPSISMSSAQRDHVVAALAAAGGSAVEQFPTVQQRLGGSATGRTDFPPPTPLGRGATMEDLVTAVFASDLLAITELLMDIERDRRPHIASLNAQLEAVRRDLRGLAHVLEPGWRERVEGLLAGVPHQDMTDATQVAMDVVDELVREVRAPKLGDVSSKEAAPLLLERAQQAALIMADRCQALTVGSSDRQWEGALGAADMLAISAAVAGPVLGKPLRRIARRLQAVTEHLRACTAHWENATVELGDLTAEEAYSLGRRMERGRATTLTERGRFVALWPDRLDELRRLLAKAKKAA
ncbi:MAG: hypothetical protein ABIS84_03780 [Arachnia sp.]